MSASHDDERPVRRLRVPVSLAVAFVGAAGAVSVFYGGCEDRTDPVDAGQLENTISDAQIDDAGVDAAPSDAAAPDTPIV